MSQNLGDLIYKISADSTELLKSLRDADASVETTSKKLDTLSKSTKDLGDKLSTNLTLPIVALGTAAVVMASNAEVSMRKFGKAFAGAGEEATAALQTLNNEYGISETQGTKLLANTGDLLKGFGATSQQALDTSFEIQKLAAALSAYNGVNVTDASQKLTKALLGETDGLVELGIKLSQTDIQQELVRTGQDKLTGSALLLAKGHITLALAAKQSGDAVASFKDNQGTAAFKTQQLMGSINDLGVSMGQALLPVVKSVIDDIMPLVKQFTDLDDNTKKNIITMAAIAAAAGPVITAISGISAALAFLAANPVVLAIAAAAALTAGIMALKKGLDDKAIKDAAGRLGAIGEAIGVNGKQILEVEKSLKGWNEVNVAGVQSWAEKLGITEKQFLQIAVASDRVSDSYKKNAQAILDNMSGVKILTAAEEERAKAAAIAAAEHEAAVKALADAEAKAAAQRAAVDKTYKDSRAQVVDILKGEQSEHDKLLAQIKELQATPWAKGTLERDRQKAVGILYDKIYDLQKLEADAAVDKIKAYSAEQATARKTVGDALTQYQTYYAEIGADQQKRLKDLQTERDKAVALAESQGKDKQSILDDYAAQEKALRDKMAATEQARIAQVKASTDAYYNAQVLQNQAKLTAIQVARDTAIAAATKEGQDTTTLKAGFAAQEAAVRAAMQADTVAKKAELDAIDTAYYAKLGSLTGDRLLQLQVERDTAIADAEAKGLATDAILAAYAAKETALRDQMLADEAARVEARKAFEQGYMDKIAEFSMTKLELLYKERDEAIAAAEKQGFDTDAIRTLYSMKAQALSDAEAQKDAEHVAALQQRQQDYYVKLEELKGNRLIGIQTERDAAIAAAEKEGLDTQTIREYYALKEKAVLDDIAKKKEEDAEAEKKKAEEVAKKKQELALSYINTFTGYAQTLLTTLGQMWDNIDATQKQNIETQLAATLAAIDAEKTANQSAYDIEVANNKSAMEAEIAAIDKTAMTEEEYANAVQAVKDSYSQKDVDALATLTAKNKEAENAKLKAKYDAEVQKYAIEKDAFKRNQAIQYAQIAISTALAVVQGYAQLGPIAGTIAAIALAAIGVAQAAVVYNQPQPVAPVAPVYLAQGGYVNKTAGGVSAKLGEGRYNEVVLPLSDRIFQKLGNSIVENLQGSTKAVTQSNLSQTIQVVMDGKVMYSVVNEGLTNRSIRVPSAAIVS